MWCLNSFNNNNDLLSHRSNVHSVHSVHCKHCKYSTTPKAYMRQHVHLHTQGIKCPECGCMCRPINIQISMPLKCTECCTGSVKSLHVPHVQMYLLLLTVYIFMSRANMDMDMCAPVGDDLNLLPNLSSCKKK